MEKKWTEGPWEEKWFLDFENYDEEGFLIEPEFNGSIVDEHGEETVWGITDIRKAHLIAASPDLYNALMVVEHCIPDSPYKKIVQAALAKARGETAV